jgi:hypothetical protein
VVSNLEFLRLKRHIAPQHHLANPLSCGWTHISHRTRCNALFLAWIAYRY